MAFLMVFCPLTEDKYMVPEKDRSPEQSIQEFYKNQEEIMHKYMLDTRSLYSTQYFVGSVVKGGFHVLMPENGQWNNHKIEFSASE
jgi:hypothetical protein